jgi:hypothetical protein
MPDDDLSGVLDLYWPSRSWTFLRTTGKGPRPASQTTNLHTAACGLADDFPTPESEGHALNRGTTGGAAAAAIVVVRS